MLPPGPLLRGGQAWPLFQQRETGDGFPTARPDDLISHALAIAQGRQAGAPQRRDMQKDVPAAFFGRDEAKSLAIIEA
jgi:hypothetical protein